MVSFVQDENEWINMLYVYKMHNPRFTVINYINEKELQLTLTYPKTKDGSMMPMLLICRIMYSLNDILSRLFYETTKYDGKRKCYIETTQFALQDTTLRNYLTALLSAINRDAIKDIEMYAYWWLCNQLNVYQVVEIIQYVALTMIPKQLQFPGEKKFVAQFVYNDYATLNSFLSPKAVGAVAAAADEVAASALLQLCP